MMRRSFSSPRQLPYRRLIVLLLALSCVVLLHSYVAIVEVLDDTATVSVSTRKPTIPVPFSGPSRTDVEESLENTQQHINRTAGGPIVALRSSRMSANGAANRAPPRPKVTFTSSSSSSSSSTTFQPICYSASGSGRPVKTQRWVRPLLYQLTHQSARNGEGGEGSFSLFDAVRDHTEKDEWQILIGWVPTKFMGPQAPGKKANGDLMIAPTKGRDPAVYWEEYNASWTATLSTTATKPPEIPNPSEHAYVFQVAHRNALAVCIRERLHTYEQFCAPNSHTRPIRIFHCPCRHCKETLDPIVVPSSSAAVVPLAHSAWPELLRPVILDLGSHITPLSSRTIHEAPFRKERTYTPHDLSPSLLSPIPTGCVEELSAPWLVPRTVVPRFPYEGYENNLDALLQRQSDADGIVLVAVLNEFWIDHLHNFYYSLVKKARMVNLIVATMDARALQVCQANRLPCFNAVAYAELEEEMQEGGAARAQGMTRKVSEAMPWIKPRLAIAVLARGYGFFMTDLDLTWGRPPLREILSLPVDLAHQCDASNRLSINSGFYFARPNIRTIRFFQNILVFAPEENSDQTAMKLFVKYDHTHGMSNVCLPKWSFNMKCNYKVEGSVVRKGLVETFEWKPFDPSMAYSILHATCLSGAKAKMQYFRSVGAWPLDELDQLTAGGVTSMAEVEQIRRQKKSSKVGGSEGGRDVDGDGDDEGAPKYCLLVRPGLDDRSKRIEERGAGDSSLPTQDDNHNDEGTTTQRMSTSAIFEGAGLGGPIPFKKVMISGHTNHSKAYSYERDDIFLQKRH